MTRRAVLPILLCGWVLWMEEYPARRDRPGGETWFIEDATETRAECLDLRTTVMASKVQIDRSAPHVTVKAGNTWVTVEDALGRRRQSFYCLPAGTDPRPRFKP